MKIRRIAKNLVEFNGKIYKYSREDLRKIADFVFICEKISRKEEREKNYFSDDEIAKFENDPRNYEEALL